MQELAVPNVYAWSRRQPDRKIYFNSYLLLSPQGNVAIDPLPLEPDDADQIGTLGGIAQIAVTNRDHVRDAATLRERFGARVVSSQAEAALLGIPVDRVVADGEELIAGAKVVALKHQKTAGEFAVHLPSSRTVLVGDAVIGTPAGSLSLLPDQKYESVTNAVLALRRLWSLQPEVLLVGDGTSLWSGATRAIGRLLLERAGIAANRINLDELEYQYFEAERRQISIARR